jgi:hypothetical protein
MWLYFKVSSVLSSLLFKIFVKINYS